MSVRFAPIRSFHYEPRTSRTVASTRCCRRLVGRASLRFFCRQEAGSTRGSRQTQVLRRSSEQRVKEIQEASFLLTWSLSRLPRRRKLSLLRCDPKPRVMTRGRLWFAFGVSELLALTVPSQAAASPERPNIIIVMPDDVGYGDYACLGNPIIHTPAADAFFKQSVRFTDFHVSPTCAPTRAALMTGRHEFRNGVTHTIYERERMTLKATTIAQVLKNAGYTTGIFGKWHLGDEPDRWPDKRGFDEMFIHGGRGIGQTFPGSSRDAPGTTYF